VPVFSLHATFEEASVNKRLAASSPCATGGEAISDPVPQLSSSARENVANMG